MTRWLLIEPRVKSLPLERQQRWTNASMTLAGRTADPLQPYPCARGVNYIFAWMKKEVEVGIVAATRFRARPAIMTRSDLGRGRDLVPGRWNEVHWFKTGPTLSDAQHTHASNL